MLKRTIPTLAVAGLALGGCGGDDPTVLEAFCGKIRACDPVDFDADFDSIGDCAEYYAYFVNYFVEIQDEADQADCEDALNVYLGCYSHVACGTVESACDDEINDFYSECPFQPE